jgi:hypothetical protein
VENEPLDTLAARAVYTAGLFERAVHHPGPWTMTWGPHQVEVQRERHVDGVVFRGEFPETCWLNPPSPNVALRCDDEVMALRSIEHPGDAAFALTWALRAKVRAGEPA